MLDFIERNYHAVPYDGFFEVRLIGVERVTSQSIQTNFQVLRADDKEFSSDRARKILSTKPFSYKAGQWMDFVVPLEKLSRVFTDNDRKILQRPNYIFRGGYSFTSASSENTNHFEFVSKGWENSTHPVTRYLHTCAKLGEIFFVSSGKGKMYYDKSMDKFIDSSIVLLGGGMGMTPFLSILKSKPPFVPAKVLLSMKKLELIPCFSELKQLVKDDLYITLTEPDTQWPGPFGRLDFDKVLEVIGLELILNKKTHYFICGPWGMTEGINEILHELGINDDHIHPENWDI